MTSRQVTALAIKILAIWLLVNIVLYLPNIAMLTASVYQFNGSETPESVSIAVFVGFLIVGFIVAITMLRISNSVLSSASEEPDESRISPAFVLQVAGVFFIVSALAVLPGYFLSLANQVPVKVASYGYLAGYLIKIAVGAYLLVKPAVWAEWFNRLRGRS